MLVGRTFGKRSGPLDEFYKTIKWQYEVFPNFTYVGSCPSYSKSVKPFKSKLYDMKFEKYLRDQQVPIPLDYARCNNSKVAALVRVNKYLLPDISSIDDHIMDLAVDDMKHLLNSYESSAPILEPPFSFPHNTSPGVNFKYLNIYTKASGYTRFSKTLNNFKKMFIKKYPVVWESHSKGEMLPSLKIEQGNLRVFCVPPLDFYILGLIMTGGLHNIMLTDRFRDISGIMMGYPLNGGGFSRLFEFLSEYPNVIESDARKFDSSFTLRIANRIKELRFFMWDKKSMSENEWWSAMDYMYYNIIYSLLLLPNGWIIMKLLGLPSGMCATTDDNCLFHLLAWCYMWRLRYGAPIYLPKLRPLIYVMGDDMIGGTIHKLTFSTRKALYASVGIRIKESDDFVSSTPEDHTFLGFRAKWSEQYSCYVPHYSLHKAMCSMLYPASEEDMTDDFLKAQRCVAFMTLLAFDDAGYNLFSKYYKDNFTSVEVELPEYFNKTISSTGQVHLQKFWLGLE